MNDTPSHLSAVKPNLQLAWDATSWSALMKCPRYYQNAILGGWRGTGVHVQFGGFFAESAEVYWKGRAAGWSREDAHRAAVRHALQITGTYEEPHRATQEYENPVWTPWGGAYLDQWKCTGLDEAGQPVRFRNYKGNVAKCPFSFKAAWFPAPGPGTCSCGAVTHTERRWVPNDNVKNRNTLVRLVSWYCDDVPDNMQVAVMPDGKPAVELSFRMPIGLKASTGEDFIVAGHLDRIAEVDGAHYVADNKTTKNGLDDRYFAQFTPDAQVDLYDLAGSILFPFFNMQGVMIEGAQTLVSGADFATRFFPRDEAYREDVLRDLARWLELAEYFADANHWPKNRKACLGCQFRETVCQFPDSERETHLARHFKQEHWNPLRTR